MKNIISSAVVSIIVIILGFVAYHPKNNAVIVKGTQPEITSPYLIVNGITQWFLQTPINQATTTLCSVPSPNASTTIWGAWIRTNTMGNITHIDIGTSTSGTGTSTNTLVSGWTAASSSGTGYVAASFGVSALNYGQNINFVSDRVSSTTGTCIVQLTQY